MYFCRRFLWLWNRNCLFAVMMKLKNFLQQNLRRIWRIHRTDISTNILLIYFNFYGQAVWRICIFIYWVKSCAFGLIFQEVVNFMVKAVSCTIIDIAKSKGAIIFPSIFLSQLAYDHSFNHWILGVLNFHKALFRDPELKIHLLKFHSRGPQNLIIWKFNRFDTSTIDIIIEVFIHPSMIIQVQQFQHINLLDGMPQSWNYFQIF